MQLLSERGSERTKVRTQMLSIVAKPDYAEA